MHVIQRVPKRMQKRTYLASERQVVNNIGVGSAARYNYSGLGEVDGMFNIGKMFTRMFTFTPSSFKLKNIAGAIGSAAMTLSTGGIANIASEIAGPSGLKLTKGSITGAHSDVSKIVGYGTMAAAAAAGAYYGGTALLSPSSGAVSSVGTAASGSKIIGTALGTGGTAVSTGGGILSTIGGALSSVGSGLMTAMQALPLVGGLLGGGGGGQQQQQGGMTQEEYDAQVRAKQEYDAQVAAQQAQMYQPGGYTPSIPFVSDQYAGAGTPAMSSYGDLRTPYTAIQEDGTQVQVDPRTGQVIQAGMIPDLSPTTWLVIGGATLVGWYFMSGSKSNN